MADYDFIAQGVRPLTDPTVQAHNAASAALAQQEARNAGEQRKLLKQQQTENDLKIQQQARAAKDQDIMNEAMTEHFANMQPGATPDYKSLIAGVAKRGGSAGAVMGLEKAVTAMQQDALKLTDEQRKNLIARHEIFGGKIEALEKLPEEQRAQVWPQVIQQSVREGALSPEELAQLPKEYPGEKHLSLTKNLLLMQGGLAKQAEQKQALALKEAETQQHVAQTLEIGAKTAETQGKTAEAARMQAAPVLAQALQNGGPEAYQAELEKLPHGIAKHFQNAKTPDDLLKIGMSANDQVKHEIERQTRRDTVAHQLKQEGFEAQRIGLEGAKSAREERIYQQTYGSGANPALVGVEPKLRTQAASAAAKVITEFENAKKSADDIQSVLDLTKAGNKAGAANVPLVGVGALNAINGIKRMNKAEIEQYGGAGSLVDKIQGKLGGWVSGQPIPADILKDMEQLHGTLRGNLEKAANDRLSGVNQTYRSNFTLPKSSPAQGSSGKVKLLAPDGSTKEVDASEVEHYKKRGAKVIQ